jgi:carbamoyl-phosphate synthase large subunit
VTALTVVLLGAGGSVSQGIHKALRLSRPPVRVVAASMDALGAGLYAGDRAVLAPALDDPGLIDWLVSLCEREGAAAVLSGVEPLLERLAAGAEEVRERCGAVCVVSPPDVLAVGEDKLATCRWLRDRSLPHPRFAAADDARALEDLVAACGLPLVAKPRRGHAAQGIFTVASLDAVAGRDDLVVQERLDGEEYTAGCLCDAGGELQATIVLRRELREGTTVRAWAGEFPEVRAVAESVVRELRPVGPCNVQLRAGPDRGGAGAVPFELNVRFSGTTPARTRFGFPEVEATLRHLVLGEPFPALPLVTEGVMVRYWNEAYPEPGALAALRDGSGLDEGSGAAVFEDWGLRP